MELACACQPVSRVQLFGSPWTAALQAPLPMGFPGKSTGEGCRFLLQEIFQIQGLNLHLLHLLNRQSGSLPLNHLGRPMQNLLIYKVGCFNSTNFLGLGRIKCKNIYAGA